MKMINMMKMLINMMRMLINMMRMLINMMRMLITIYRPSTLFFLMRPKRPQSTSLSTIFHRWCDRESYLLSYFGWNNGTSQLNNKAKARV